MILAPNNFVNPNTPTITTPLGVDAVIQALQISYSDNLTWLEKSFGRAYIRSRKTDNERDSGLLTRSDYTFPEVWQGDGIDPMNALANDNLNSYSFFLKTGDEEPINYEQYTRNRYVVEIANIFWMDLKLVDPDSTYPNTEQYLQEVKKLITNTRLDGLKGLSVEIINVEEDPNDVFRPFTLDLAETQHLAYPKFGFRINMNAYFSLSC